MAALLIGGSIAAIDKIREKRAGKRRSAAAASLEQASPSTSPTSYHANNTAHDFPPPSFSTSNLHSSSHNPTVAEEKERMRLEDAAAAVRTGEPHPSTLSSQPTEQYTDAHDEDVPAYEHNPQNQHNINDAAPPPEYDAPPYSLHRSDALLESSRPAPSSTSNPSATSRRQSRGLFPRPHTLSTPLTGSTATDTTVAESSTEALAAERAGRTKCVVGPDGRCACGKRERSPNAPLGETVKERRERKFKEKFSLQVILLSHGLTGRWYDDSKQFRYWRD